MAFRPNPITGAVAAGLLAGTERLGLSQGGGDRSATIGQIAAAVGALLSAPALTQPTASRVYQRDTQAGGTFGYGSGVVAITVQLAMPVSQLEYRLRDAANTATVLLDWTRAAGAVPAGSTTLSPSVPASASCYLMDLRANGCLVGMITGTQAFGVGEVVAVTGQSLAVNALGPETLYGSTDNATTLASLGIVPAATSAEYATWEPANALLNATPSWATPADGTVYASAFAAEFLRVMTAKLGVPVGIVGHARGGVGIAALQAGTPDGTQLRSVLAAAGGKFGTLLYVQGHGDAQTSNTTAGYAGLGNALSGAALAAAWQAALGTLVAGLGNASSLPFRTVICTVPAVTTLFNAPAANLNAIRAAGRAYAAANPLTATAIDGLDLAINTSDGVGAHPLQAGNLTLARHFARAVLAQMGQGSGDSGPVISAASRATAASGKGGIVTLTIGNAVAAGYPAPGLALVGAPASQFQVFPAGTTTGAYAVSSVSVVSATQLALTLVAPPGDNAAVDVWHRYPADASASVAMSGVYDTNVADGIGSNGRQLAVTVAPVTAAAPVPSAAAPGNVLGLAAGTPSNTTIPVTYAAPSGAAVSGYAGQTSLDGATWVANNGAFGATGGSFVGLGAATGYHVRIVATNGNGSSATVLAGTVTTAPNPAVAAGALVAAFDAAGSSATVSGGVVTALSDSSGNGNGLVASGTGPALTAGAQNGLPVLTFGGSQALTSGAGATWMGGASGLQGDMSGLLVYVAQETSNTVVASIFAAGSSSIFYINTAGGGNAARTYTDGQGFAVIGASATGLNKTAWRYTAASGLLEVWNSAETKATHGFTPGSGPSWTSLQLGQFPGATNLTGTIAEARFYRGLATDAEIAALQAYATSKWGS